MVVNKTFQYRVHGMSPNYVNVSHEGEVMAVDAQGAMSILRQLSVAWNYRSIESVAVYSIDENGEVSVDPDIVDTTFSKQSIIVTGGKTGEKAPKISHDVTKDKISDKYAKADWLSSASKRETFQTVTPKGG